MNFTEKCQDFFKRDRFAMNAGIGIVEAKPGYARVKMEVRDMHLNGADLLHGGALFTLADFAVAVASNGHGRIALSVATSMSFFKSAKAGDIVEAVAKELSLGHKMGTYSVEISKAGGEMLASMQETVYRKEDVIPQLAPE
jgi:acyl-CoA thioesterase